MAADYGTAIDIWAVGCILAELIGRKPIFKGKDHLDQVDQIITVLGFPSEADRAWLQSSGAARRFIAQFSGRPGQKWLTVLPDVSKRASAALDSILRFDPGQRPSAKECLRLPYFAQVYHKEEETERSTPVDWSFDNFTPTRQLLQERFREECADVQAEQ